MAARPAKKAQNYSRLLLESLQNKFPNLLLGFTVLVIIVLLASLAWQKGGKDLPVAKSLTQFLTGQKGEEEKEPKTYIVKDGDHLWTIAELHYGSGYNAYDLAKANNIQDPDLLTSGQKLVIPELTPAEATGGDVSSLQIDSPEAEAQTYVVKEGDQLWKIAQGVYGVESAWLKIAEANNLKDPDTLFVGQILTLPR